MATDKKQKRVKIPGDIQSRLLLANRHACCVCQKPKVHIHHIDEDPSNNHISNLAILCVDCHAIASMKMGMNKKISSVDVKKYKATWELKCANDIMALSRNRVNYYLTLYKNPPRIRQLFGRLSEKDRNNAYDYLEKIIKEENDLKSADPRFQMQATPSMDRATMLCLGSALAGENWPSWLNRVAGHPEDPDYPNDLSSMDGYTAFNEYDRYCQILVQYLTFKNQPIPLEEIRRFAKAKDIDQFAGSLISFRGRSYGKDIHLPSLYENYPTGKVRIIKKRNKIKYFAVMMIRTMYIFSTTSALNLMNSQICGIAMLGGASEAKTEKGKEVTINMIPLLIGMGGSL